MAENEMNDIKPA